MTSRPNDSPGTNCQTRSDGRSDQESSTKVEEEGCPVIEESGAVCGETRTLSIFQEFRQIYNECMRRMESNKEDNLALRKLAPFRKLVEDLWEQNVMLVETVEELEQEATSRVASLQNKLDQCSDKDTQNLLRQKDREICCLTLEITNKNDLLSKYYNQIDELRRDMKSRSKKYQEILCRLKDAAVQRLDQLPCDEMEFEDDGEHGEGVLESLFNALMEEIDCQKLKFAKRAEEAEYLASEISEENSRIINEKSEMAERLEELKMENCGLKSELNSLRSMYAENGELEKKYAQVKEERDQLLERVNSLHQNIQELDASFKSTKWALTAEVAEKHDQIQELRRNLACLEEQVRQADMKTLFKDDVIKEMRKELKNSRAVVHKHENVTKPPNGDPTEAQSWRFDKPVKENPEDLKLDIHLFPLNENKCTKTRVTKFRSIFSQNNRSVEVQTERKRNSLCKTRNVSTQHSTPALKLPRSFGTLTVLPWSGAGGEGVTWQESLQRV